MHSLKLHFYNPKKDTEGVWNKIVSYLDPPYCHCEIEFLQGLACAVYLNGPVHMKKRQQQGRTTVLMNSACWSRQTPLPWSWFNHTQGQGRRTAFKSLGR